MLAMVLWILGFTLFIALVIAFYVWTRRTESDMDFEQAPGVKSAEQADALRLGIALNASNPQLGGH
jgi:threonine/homoserine/homoserine lactone efflux protein